MKRQILEKDSSQFWKEKFKQGNSKKQNSENGPFWKGKLGNVNSEKEKSGKTQSWKRQF